MKRDQDTPTCTPTSPATQPRRTASGKTALAGLGLAVALTLAGCSSYYQITDPTGGRDYYTTGYKQDRNGAVTFRDMHSGADVTLQNTEIRKVPESEAKAAGTPSTQPDA